jgi:hypothetical protein
MPTFKDNKGREWSLSIDVYLLDQVEQRVDGLKPVKFVRVLWVLIEEDAKARSVTPEQFGRALAGDALEAAASAFVDAVALFSPSRPRKLIRAMMEAGEKVSDRATARALEAIEKTSATLFSSATNSPESPELIPAG